MDDGDLKEFLAESREQLDAIDADLVELEAAPRDAERLARVFRFVHTIKGTCGFFGFARLEAVTHAAENLLSGLRAGEVVLDQRMAASLFAAMDAVRSILRSIEAGGGEGEADFAAIIDALGRHARSEPVEPATAEPAGAAPAEAETSVRVDVAVLDRLMNLVGELVLIRNETLLNPEHPPVQRLDRLTSELQETTVHTRMQPIGTHWRTLPRVVRDLAAKLGQQVDLVIEGEETELDRSIIEAVRDPITHLVRNAIDHGLESAADRERAGKPAAGKLRLRAFHEGGQVHLEVEDDGRGIDIPLVVERAVAAGAVEEREVHRLGPRELLPLIFRPGVSTARDVTHLSGRGVGMDVVKTNVERTGGTIEIDSEPGRGTRFRITLPLTLAIMPALVVECGGLPYALPQATVREVLRFDDLALETVGHAPAFRLRGARLPLLDLGLLFGGRATPASSRVVVVQARDRRYGLLLDAVDDAREIVVKPLGRVLEGIAGLSGTTILGDGRVALILDPAGLADRAGILEEVPPDDPEPAPAEEPNPRRQPQPVLVFQTPDDGRLLMRLDLVVRLEEFERGLVRHRDGRDTVSWEERELPLVHLRDVLPERRALPRHTAGAMPPTLFVAICRRGDRQAGIVADRMVDIVETPLHPRRPGSREGVRGTIVLNGRVTEILDAEAALRRADPAFFDTPSTAEQQE